MNFLTALSLLLSGFFLLFLGGELLVKSSIQLAKKWKVSSLFIGLTIVSIGTSTPELFASLFASLTSIQDVALGNIIGSNIFNLLMIIGVTGLIKPLPISPSLIKVEWSILLLSTLAFLIVIKDSSISAWEGGAFLIGFIGFLYLSFYRVKYFPSSPIKKEEILSPKFTQSTVLKSMAFLSLGIFCLSFGAYIALKGGVQLGRAFNLSETVIGLVFISIGTGLPELFTSMVATLRGENQIAISNVIGSNIINTLGITSLISLIKPLTTKEPSIYTETLILLGLTFLFIPLFKFSGFKLKRKPSLLLIGLYGIYLWKLFYYS